VSRILRISGITYARKFEFTMPGVTHGGIDPETYTSNLCGTINMTSAGRIRVIYQINTYDPSGDWMDWNV
jgi:hypothetical protein